MRIRSVRSCRLSAACALLAACLLAPTVAAHPQNSAPASNSSPTKTTTTKRRKSIHASAASRTSTTRKVAGKSRRSSRRRVRGQQKIDSERAQAIQEALIREHYLTGEPTGVWNQASEAAMRRYQADNGWQSKTVPDSRALIKLGLGPSKDHLLNPESAMTTTPDAPRATALIPASHGADPAVPASKTRAAETPQPASSAPADSSSPQNPSN